MQYITHVSDYVSKQTQRSWIPVLVDCGHEPSTPLRPGLPKETISHVPLKWAWSARAGGGMLTHVEGLLNQRLHLVVTFPVQFTHWPVYPLRQYWRPHQVTFFLPIRFSVSRICRHVLYYDGRSCAAQIDVLVSVRVFHEVSSVVIQWIRVELYTCLNFRLRVGCDGTQGENYLLLLFPFKYHAMFGIFERSPTPRLESI